MPILTEDVITLAATRTGGTQPIVAKTMMIAIIPPIRIIAVDIVIVPNDPRVGRSAFDQAQPSVKEANRESVAGTPPSTDEPSAVSRSHTGMAAKQRSAAKPISN